MRQASRAPAPGTLRQVRVVRLPVSGRQYVVNERGELRRIPPGQEYGGLARATPSRGEHGLRAKCWCSKCLGARAGRVAHA